MTSSPQSYEQVQTIHSDSSFTHEVKRSLFVALLSPVQNKNEALGVLERCRKEHREAAHHCYAWRLGLHGLDYRMSDDGEPSGTAGKPMLFTLQRSRLVNVVVVVARYFGGVKLGTGPLARAYAEAVSGAIAQASVMPVVPREELAVHCIYDDVSRIIQLLDEVDASYQPIYGDAVLFEVSVPLSKKDYLLEQLTVRTNARAGFSKIATQGEEINRRRH